MSFLSKYDRDCNRAWQEIEAAIDGLTESVGDEIIVTVLVWIAKEHLEGFTDLAQWEIVKPALLDIRDEFEVRAEPFWLHEVDLDKVVEEYERRYAKQH